MKRHAIHHSLYGVDLDPGAVEIAKLRLWLSMVVDEDDIHDIQPLPNLDYKIMQGNSLLEEFEGVRLFDERILVQAEEGSANPRIGELEERQRLVAREINRLLISNQLSRTAAKNLKDEAAQLSKELYSLKNPSDKKIGDHPELNLGPREILKRIQQLQDEFFDANGRTEKKTIRGELSALEWEFMRATLREQGREEAIDDLEEASAKHRKPFFLWWLHFSEIKKRLGGFDIVMANPPFVRMELIKDEKPALKRRFPELFSGRADLYVYFYGLGLDILRDGGCLTFVSSNSYLNSKFGGKLRERFLKATSIETIIDFAETRVFDAVVEPAIILLKKGSGTQSTVRTVKWKETQPLDDLPEVVAKDATKLPRNSFTAEPWQLVGGGSALLLERIRHGKKTLADYSEWKPLRGVVTGLNDAFVINGKERAEIIRDNPQAEEIIHRFLRGRDISRWNARFEDTYIIYTYHGVDITHYPLIEKRLRQYKPGLEARATEQAWYELQQPQMAYEKYFRGPKLVYQEINRTDAFAYDLADPSGMFVNNKVFFIPNAPKALLALMSSTVASFFIHTLSGVPPGGFLALQLNIINPLPIPNWSKEEQGILDTLTDYVLWLNCIATANGDLPDIAGYFKQWINALVYELFFPEKLHATGLYFFDIAEENRLQPLSALKGKELPELQKLFEKLYLSSDPLRQGLFALDSIEEVRIIEGKA